MSRIRHHNSYSLYYFHRQRTLFLLCLWTAIILNMLKYKPTQIISQDIGLNYSQIVNTTETANDDFDTNSFLVSTLASRLIDLFADSDELSELYDNDNPIIYNMSTPQGKAFHWMLNFDRYKHSKSITTTYDPSDNPTVIQRYILIVLFFATGGNFNNDLGSSFTPDDNKVGHWTNDGMLNFLSSNLHECSWNSVNSYGVLKGVGSCDKKANEITQLMLPEAALIGELPEELGFLTSLETLDFQNNHINGKIPQSLARLTSLRKLGMAFYH